MTDDPIPVTADDPIDDTWTSARFIDPVTGKVSNAYGNNPPKKKVAAKKSAKKMTKTAIHAAAVTAAQKRKALTEDLQKSIVEILDKDIEEKRKRFPLNADNCELTALMTGNTNVPGLALGVRQRQFLALGLFTAMGFDGNLGVYAAGWAYRRHQGSSFTPSDAWKSEMDNFLRIPKELKTTHELLKWLGQAKLSLPFRKSMIKIRATINAHKHLHDEAYDWSTRLERVAGKLFDKHGTTVLAREVWARYLPKVVSERSFECPRLLGFDNKPAHGWQTHKCSADANPVTFRPTVLRLYAMDFRCADRGQHTSFVASRQNQTLALRMPCAYRSRDFSKNSVGLAPNDLNNAVEMSRRVLDLSNQNQCIADTDEAFWPFVTDQKITVIPEVNFHT